MRHRQTFSINYKADSKTIPFDYHASLALRPLDALFSVVERIKFLVTMIAHMDERQHWMKIKFEQKRMLTLPKQMTVDM